MLNSSLGFDKSIGCPSLKTGISFGMMFALLSKKKETKPFMMFRPKLYS